MDKNVLYPDNVKVRLMLEGAWNLAASDRLTWAELEQLGKWITDLVEEFKKEYDIK
jgi:hypothetical protein